MRTGWILVCISFCAILFRGIGLFDKDVPTQDLGVETTLDFDKKLGGEKYEEESALAESVEDKGEDEGVDHETVTTLDRISLSLSVLPGKDEFVQSYFSKRKEQVAFEEKLLAFSQEMAVSFRSHVEEDYLRQSAVKEGVVALRVPPFGEGALDRFIASIATEFGEAVAQGFSRSVSKQCFGGFGELEVSILILKDSNSNISYARHEMSCPVTGICKRECTFIPLEELEKIIGPIF